MVTSTRSGAICMVGGSILVDRSGSVDGRLDGRLDGSRVDNTDSIRAGFGYPS